MSSHRILLAGMGNELREDDGFGIAVARAYKAIDPPARIRVYEAGIAGVALVQELMDGFDTMIVVDAIDRGGEPGTLYVLECEVPDLSHFDERDREAFLADTHYTIPSKALILGRALGVLPPSVYIVGCQPRRCELGMGLNEPVAEAVDPAVDEIQTLSAKLLQGEVHVSGNTA